MTNQCEYQMKLLTQFRTDFSEAKFLQIRAGVEQNPVDGVGYNTVACMQKGQSPDELLPGAVVMNVYISQLMAVLLNGC